MASKRRGGFRPPELRGTLGTLLRTTTDVVRDAIERGARSGRARLDDVRAGRRRQDALADLGELVLDLIRRGEIDLAELPEARELVHRLDELDAEAADDDVPEPPRATSRSRFDDRPVPSPSRSVPGALGGRGPAAGPGREPGRFADTRFAPADDGTVSSGAALRRARAPAPAPAPARPAGPGPDTETPSTRAPTKPMKGFPRHFPGEPPPDDDAPRRPTAPTLPRQGGISFEDDDLSDYMHPDDVPAKDPGAGEA